MAVFVSNVRVAYCRFHYCIRSGKPEVTGKICVIGSKLDEDKLAELFRK